MKCHRDISVHVSRTKDGLAFNLIISSNNTDMLTQIRLLSLHIVTECHCSGSHFCSSACGWSVLIACLNPPCKWQDGTGKWVRTATSCNVPGHPYHVTFFKVRLAVHRRSRGAFVKLRKVTVTLVIISILLSACNSSPSAE